MIQKIVSFALRYRVFVAVLAGGLVIVGLIAFHHLPIEAYPNPVPPPFEVIAQRPLAIVVIGGTLILAVVPHILQPLPLVLVQRRFPRLRPPALTEPVFEVT